MKTDKERLKELEWAKQVIMMNQVAADMDGTTTGDQDFSKAVDIIVPLIDSALAEPSDADVADAIEDFVNWEKSGWSKAETPNHSNLILALAALRQYQPPTDEEVHPDDLDAATIDAIEWLEFMKRCHNELWNSADEEDRLEPGAYEQHKSTLKAFDLAIQGLHQMRTDPCEWCDKTLTLFTNSGKFIPENQPPRNYCTNCGRKLVKHDG